MGAESRFAMNYHVDETASRRNTANLADRTSLGIPSTYDIATDGTALTRGGAEIYRRTHRPAPTCNVIAMLAGIGVEQEVR